MSKELVFSFKRPDIDALKCLFQNNDFGNLQKFTDKEIELMITQSLHCVSVFDDNCLIAFGRLVADSECKYRVTDVVISRAFRMSSVEQSIYNILLRKCLKKVDIGKNTTFSAFLEDRKI